MECLGKAEHEGRMGSADKIRRPLQAQSKRDTSRIWELCRVQRGKELMKKILDRIFVDGLSGMAQGLFATLIIGTIIQQIGTFAGGNVGDLIYLVGKMAAGLTGAGIGAGVARKLDAGTSGRCIRRGRGNDRRLCRESALRKRAGGRKSDPGWPGRAVGRFCGGVYAAIELGILISGKTRLDIILTPLVCIGAGSVVGLLVGPPISGFMAWLGSLINWGTEQQPFLMGIIVSVLMGMILTLPISSAALGVILNLSGLAAGSGYGGLLLQYDRIRRGELAGE